MINKLVTIAPLKDRPEYAPILALWAYHEWYKERNLAFDIVLKAFIGRTKDELLPQTFTALADSLPVGMVTLKLDDLWVRKDLNPWLSSLYVVPEFRDRGVGHNLVIAVIKRAGELGFGNLHLFLGQREPSRLESYYIKRGWEILDHSKDNDGFDTKILRYGPVSLSDNFFP